MWNQDRFINSIGIAIIFLVLCYGVLIIFPILLLLISFISLVCFLYLIFSVLQYEETIGDLDAKIYQLEKKITQREKYPD